MMWTCAYCTVRHLEPTESDCGTCGLPRAPPSQDLAAAAAAAAVPSDVVAWLRWEDAQSSLPGLLNALSKCYYTYNERLPPARRLRIALSRPLSFVSQRGTYGSSWSCGYRNIQQLCSSLASANAAYKSALFGSGVIPDIESLQVLIEKAWGLGFDPDGAAQLGRSLQGTSKYIGSAECVALLRSQGFDARLVAFHSLDSPVIYQAAEELGQRAAAGYAERARSEYAKAVNQLYANAGVTPAQLGVRSMIGQHQAFVAAPASFKLPRGAGSAIRTFYMRRHAGLIRWLRDYFGAASSVAAGTGASSSATTAASSRPFPLYFQHDGHSRTIVGFEERPAEPSSGATTAQGRVGSQSTLEASGFSRLSEPPAPPRISLEGASASSGSSGSSSGSSAASASYKAGLAAILRSGHAPPPQPRPSSSTSSSSSSEIIVIDDDSQDSAAPPASASKRGSSSSSSAMNVDHAESATAADDDNDDDEIIIIESSVVPPSGLSESGALRLLGSSQQHESSATATSSSSSSSSSISSRSSGASPSAALPTGISRSPVHVPSTSSSSSSSDDDIITILDDEDDDIIEIIEPSSSYAGVCGRGVSHAGTSASSSKTSAVTADAAAAAPSPRYSSGTSSTPAAEAVSSSSAPVLKKSATLPTDEFCLLLFDPAVDAQRLSEALSSNR